MTTRQMTYSDAERTALMQMGYDPAAYARSLRERANEQTYAILHSLGIDPAAYRHAADESRRQFAAGDNYSPYQLNPRLTQISQTVQVEGLIADEVCPWVDVGGPVFRYETLPWDQAMTIPDVALGRTSRANQMEYGGTLAVGEVKDWGLEAPVALRDQAAAGALGQPSDPRAVAVVSTTQILRLAREKRVATLVTTAANYGAFHTTLNGSSQWSDFDDSDPRKEIIRRSSSLLMRPNVLVCGREVWDQLSQHPKIVEMIRGTGAGDKAVGVITPEEFQQRMGLRVLIGEPWYNSAHPGAAATQARVWGKDAAVLRINPRIMSTMGSPPSWCFTAGWGSVPLQVMSYMDPSRGVRGTDVQKITQECVELVSYQALGFLWKDAVA